MRIAVCDDMDSERERLASLLNEYAAARDLAAEIVPFASGEALAGAFAPGAFGLVLLDIYLGGITGIETARRLKALDADCAIVFATTSAEHGADAFDVEAFHYLVKPIRKEKLFSVLDRWYESRCAARAISLKCGRAAREVLVRDILYIDVQGHSTSVHLPNLTLESSQPLAALEALLPEGEFCRPIRYCLVGMRHVLSLGEEHLILRDGERIPISRRERINLRERLAAYRLRALRRR